MCIIVTFQRGDREIIDQQKENLNSLLWSLIDTDQDEVLFSDSMEGIRFSGTNHK
jgi:hypothetical protein